MSGADIAFAVRFLAALVAHMAEMELPERAAAADEGDAQDKHRRALRAVHDRHAGTQTQTDRQRHTLTHTDIDTDIDTDTDIDRHRHKDTDR
eukprot:3049117-Rhodomonas_salina.2